MNSKFSVGFIQFNTSNDIDRNVDFVKSEVDRLIKDNMDLIVLPELWSCGFNYKILSKAAEKTPDILKEIAVLTKERHVTIVGSLPEKSGGRLYNTAFAVDPKGKVISKYRKIHLFPPLKEDKHFTPGKDTAVFLANKVRVGLVICFDIRFPELIRKLAAQKISILVVCAQWPKVRYHQWITLIKARAIENQIFVVAVNRCGIQEDQEFLGHSIIVNPYGETVYEAHEYEESVDALIDIGLIGRFKKQFDLLALRNPKAYK
jgi:predicted amidohydrolase